MIRGASSYNANSIRGELMISNETVERLASKSRKEGFAKWLEEPLVKVLISQQPEGDRQDELRSLLQAAFDSGHASGQAVVLMSFLEEMIKQKGYGR
jgi:isoleucyl-tRNA synthetase